MRTITKAIAVAAVAAAAAAPAAAASPSFPNVDDTNSKYYNGYHCEGAEDVILDLSGSHNRVATVTYSRLPWLGGEFQGVGKVSVIKVYKETPVFDQSGLHYESATYSRPGPPESQLLTCSSQGIYDERTVIQVKVLGPSPLV